MMRCLLVLGLAASLACGGCSYALMRPAPADPEQREWVDCTSSRVAPVADVVGVVQGVGIALAVQVFDSYGVLGEGDREVSAEGRAVQVVALGVAAAYTASSIYGFSSASDCERAKGLATMHQLEQVRSEASAAPPAPPGCLGDADCKAGRRCIGGGCAWPPSASPVPDPTVPAPPPAPEPTAPASPPAPAR